jgi:uncharacterized membrane protein YfcA
MSSIAIDAMDPTFIVVAGLAALMVGLSKGGLSLLGSVAVPMMALVMSPVKAAALLLPIFVVSDWVGLWSYRKEFDRRNLVILTSAGIVGIALGWATASLISDRVVGLIIGFIGVGFCVNTWRLRHHALAARAADLPRGMFWGTIMGFSSFVSHSGGPPYQVYVLPQQLSKTVYAGTTTILFAMINAVKLVPYWALGQLSLANLRVSLWLVPIAIGGTLAGVRLVRVMPQAIYFATVQLLLFAVSLKLIFDGLAPAQVDL